MTADRDFKTLIRDHMIRTGLSYQAARRSLLATQHEEHDVNNQTTDYGPDAIEGPVDNSHTLADIRRRPTKYIVDTGPAGIEHLCMELVANSIDEFIAGHATNVAVAVGEDGSIFVRDDGRGIPIDPPAGETGSTLEKAILEPGASGKRAGDYYPAAGGKNGLGITVVTALSSRVRVWVERDGNRYEAEFSSTDDAPGHVVHPARRTGSAGLGRTTAVQFWPDASVFGDATIDIEHLRDRLGLLAALTDGLTVTLAAPGAAPRVVASPDGLGGLLGSTSTTTHKVVRDTGIALVATTRAESDSRVVRSFVNGTETVGGDHVEAVLESLPPGNWRAIVSVWVRQPVFEPTHDGHVVHHQAARDLVTAAMTSSHESQAG
jgi:DNA gyrase/topoisomerase IV subunit B